MNCADLDNFAPMNRSHGQPVSEVIESNYRNYTFVRDRILQQLACQSQTDSVTRPSDYWSEELGGFDYLLEASPLLVNKLRQQSYHITGLKHYDYRSSQNDLKKQFESKLGQLTKLDPTGELFVEEASILGGFGHLVNGKLVNIDTLKFYESLIVMKKAGLIDRLKRQKQSLVAEIGSGWGGFAYQLKKLIPSITYVLIDFPEVFIFSGTYLKTAFPNAKMFFVGSEDGMGPANLCEYDFVFIPQQMFKSFWKYPVDLVVNMVSFQEMTTQQVESYVCKFKETGTKTIYSHNRERSKHNRELSKVSEVLEKHYDISLIRILDSSYTNLQAKVIDAANYSGEAKLKKQANLDPKDIGQRIKDAIKHFTRNSPSKATRDNAINKKPKDLDRWGLPALDYHHFVGYKRN